MRRFKFTKIKSTEEMIRQLNITRRIKEIHIHHTWRPNLEMYEKAADKERVIYNMYRYHTDVRKFSDIAQHFTVVPGGVWDGRDINLTPASISGSNTGAICIETIGDFDIEDFFSTSKESNFTLVSALLKKIEKEQGKRPEIVFHNERAAKSCPGKLIDKKFYLRELSIFMKEDYPEWKKAGVKYLAENGIIDSPDDWLRQLDQSVPAWAIFLILSRILKKILKN